MRAILNFDFFRKVAPEHQLHIKSTITGGLVSIMTVAVRSNS